MYVELVVNSIINENENYLSQIKEIMKKSNNDFIPNLFDRIIEGDTLDDKINNRILDRLSKDYHYILVFEDEKIIGFTEIKIGDSELNGEILFGINVGTTVIDKDNQGRGVAKLLYTKLDELALEFKVDVVLRSTWSLNLRQLKLYDTFGYTEVGREVNARGEGNDLLKYCKWFK